MQIRNVCNAQVNYIKIKKKLIELRSETGLERFRSRN
jgi:hypothetical protein